MDFAIQFLANGRDLGSGEFQSTEALGDLGHPPGGYTLDHPPAGGLQIGDEGLLATLVAFKEFCRERAIPGLGNREEKLAPPEY